MSSVMPAPVNAASSPETARPGLGRASSAPTTHELTAAAVRGLPLFRELGGGELEVLARLFTLRDFRRGDRVLPAGPEGRSVLLLARGRLRVTSVAVTSGREITLHRFCAGSVAGLDSLLGHGDRRPHAPETFAETDGTLARAPAASVLEAMSSVPALGRVLLGEALRQLRDAEDFARRVCTSSVEARVAAALVELSLPDGGAPVLREELAGRAAATRESVSRALRRFAGQGLVRLDGRLVAVPDTAALSRAATPGEPVPCYGSADGADPALCG